MSLTVLLESILGAGAGVSVLVWAVVRSLNLKISKKLRPGDTVLHIQDTSEPYWMVDYVWFYGLRLSGPNGRVKYMATRDYLLLNNVSGPVWCEVEIAVPADEFHSRPHARFYATLREAVVESAKDFLTSTETESIAILLDNLETTFTFAVKFQIQSYRDKRQAESLVRRALMTQISFADRAVLAASITIPAEKSDR